MVTVYVFFGSIVIFGAWLNVGFFTRAEDGTDPPQATAAGDGDGDGLEVAEVAFFGLCSRAASRMERPIAATAAATPKTMPR